jgi:transcriptional regulator with XRE-family HTH domain
VTEEASTLAGRVRKRRRALGLSQQAVAVRAGLSVSMVAQIEQGAKKDPRVSTVSALAGALEVSVDYLIGRDGAAPRPKPSRRGPKRKGDSP